jgi:hypothetical protein
MLRVHNPLPVPATSSARRVVEPIGSTTAVASSTVSLTWEAGVYSNVIVEFNNLSIDTSMALRLQLIVSGSTYATSYYGSMLVGRMGTTSTYIGSSATTSATIADASFGAIGATAALSFRVEMLDVSGSSSRKIFTASGNGGSPTDRCHLDGSFATGDGNLGPVTGLRIFTSAGTISGAFTVFGVRNV